MRETQTVTRSDADAVLRINNDLRDLPDGPGRYQYLLEETCRLVGAQIGVFGLARDVHPERSFVCVAWGDCGWSSEAERNLVMNYCERPPEARDAVRDPMESLMFQSGRVVTRRRAETVSDRHWYRTDNVAELRRPGRIDDCVYSFYHLPAPTWVAGLVVHRPWGDRARFTRRDREVLDMLNTHLGWLWTRDPNYLRAASDGNGGGLSPRLRQTLDLLLTGRSEKEIAAAMKLNRGTVHKYVTALYRRYDVNSRAQLLARHVSGRVA